MPSSGIKIGNMSQTAGPITGGELFEVVQQGVSRKLTWPVLMAGINAGVVLPGFHTVSMTTSRSLALTDRNSIIHQESAVAQTLTIPAQASVNWTDPTTIMIVPYGAGSLTLQAASGVRLNGVNGGSVPLDRYQNAVLHWINADNWVVSNTATVPGDFIDLFVIVGQSNAEGRGTAGPAAPHGVYVNGATGVVTTPLADPVGDAVTGSMWPAFSNEWFALTGRKSAFVEAARGSTRLLDYGTGIPTDTWAPSGSLRGTAVAYANTAIAALVGYDIQNVFYVWAQGEGDAENLDGSHTAAMYTTALQDLATYFNANTTGGITQMAVVRSASNINDATKDAGYFAIRQSQEDACTASALLTMAYRGTYSFRPLAYMFDSLHYNQAGLDLAGKCAARGLWTPEAIPTLAAIPAPNAYPDTDYATTANTRTQAHTTAADTNFLVVAVAAMRPGSNTTFTVVSVTYNGVAMKEARQTADNGTTAGRAVAGIFYLDEATYGGSLGGVTANIVVTLTAAVLANLIDIVGFNSKDADFIDYANSSNLTGDAAGLTLDYYTGAPTFTVVVAASCGPGAVAATCLLSGATEVLDAGGTNGTRTGQACVGYAEDAAPYGPRTLIATFSAVQNAICLLSASFRKHWDGEF